MRETPSMDVEALLNSLRKHGTIDSQEGSFSLSLSDARRKLIKYQSSNPRRYLILILAALQAAGATQISISRKDFQFTLYAPGALIKEEALTHALAGRSNDHGSPGVTDLALAIRLAFKCDCERIALTQSCDGEVGFHWELNERGEATTTHPRSDRVSQTIEINFGRTWKRRATGFLKFLGGYVGQNREVRFVIECCDKSRIPIFLDRESIHQPLIPSDSALRAVVGAPRAGLKADLFVEDFDWEGVLELQRGRLEIVRHGVTYSRLEGTGLNGVVWHPRLKLDLSRENILCDPTYEKFLRELDQVRGQLYEKFASGLLSEPEDLVLENLHNLVSCCVAGQRPEATHQISAWMVAQFKSAAPCRASKNKVDLVKLYLKLPRALPDFKPRSLIILDLCAAALEERLPGVDELLSDAASLIQASYPQDYLAAGYLLLGLGACLHTYGQPNIGRRVWREAVRTVEASKDPRNKQLIEAHLEFEVDHMMLEVAKALRIYQAGLEAQEKARL